MGANQSHSEANLSLEAGARGERTAADRGHHSHCPGAGGGGVTEGHKKNKAKPQPPHKPVVVDTTHNTITLSWSPPRHATGQPVIAYTVEVQAPDGDRQWKVLTKSCQGSSYVARHLEMSSEYVFKVRAENVYGLSKASPCSDVACTKMYDTSSPDGTFASDATVHASPRHSDARAVHAASRNFDSGSGHHTTSLTSSSSPPPASSSSQSGVKRRHSFNIHLDGGVTKILNHSDIVVNSTSRNLGERSLSLSSSDQDRPDKAQTLTRNNVLRTSLQSNRKVSLPILLPGTGTSCLNRLREPRNSLRSSSSELNASTGSRDAARLRNRQSRSSVSSSVSDLTTSTNSKDENYRKKQRDSRDSIHSSNSDATVSNSRDGCSSNDSHSGSLCDCSIGADGSDATSGQNAINTRKSQQEELDEDNNNNNNKNNDTNTFNSKNNEGIDEHDGEEDDISQLKTDLKNFEITEEKLKFHDLKEKLKIHAGRHREEHESQKGYYASLENPWEKDTSVNGVSERIMAAPFCDDIKMALYARNFAGDAALLGYPVSANQMNFSGDGAMENTEGNDFRTLRSVLQSDNLIVKTSRSLPDVVGVVFGDEGVARTLTRGKLTTIVDADEEEDAVRVTTL